MTLEIPTIAPESIVALLIGLVVDFDFAMRRLRGFGRHVLAKLPQYTPPEDETAAESETAKRIGEKREDGS